MPNLFANIAPPLAGELFDTLLNADHVRIERIVSDGHVSPPDFWYDQQQPEFVVLLQGAARLQFEDETVEMKPGDFIHIPAHRKHRVAWTTPEIPTIWLAVHYDSKQ